MISDAELREKKLSKLMSGMDNLQPNINMFGSNVFSSIVTDINQMNIKESYDDIIGIKSINHSSSRPQLVKNTDLDDILTAEKPIFKNNQDYFTMGKNPFTADLSLHHSSENLTINN
jgi:hypothetical protein